MYGIGSEKQQFLLVSISPGSAIGTKVLYSDDGEIIDTKQTFATPGHIPFGRFAFTQPLALSLHPALCHIVELPFRIKTEKSTSSFMREVGRLVEQLLYEHRISAAKALNVSEMDAVLIDAHIGDLHQKKDIIVGVLYGVFTNREVFDLLQAYIHAAPRFFLTHPLKSSLACLHHAHEDEKVHALYLEKEQGFLYGREGGKSPIYQKEIFSWTPQRIVSSIANEWSVDEQSAKEIYSIFLRGACSSSTQSFLQKIIQKETKSFFKELTEKSINGKIYIKSSLPLPFNLPTDYRWKKILPLPDNLLGEDSVNDGALAPAQEFLSILDYADIHRAIQRKIHWITTPER